MDFVALHSQVALWGAEEFVDWDSTVYIGVDALEVAQVTCELQCSCLYLDLSRAEDQVRAVVVDSLDLLLCVQTHWLSLRTNRKEKALG